MSLACYNVAMNTDYAEFNDLRLAEVYDSFCPLGKDSDFFLREVKKAKPKSILDVGCGSGILTIELTKIADEVVGVEPALPMLELARKRTDGEKVSWLHGYAKDVEGIQPDVIIMTSHVAQFFLDEDDWQSTLQHLSNLLKKGGKLIFDSRNPLVKPWLGWSEEKTKRSANTPHGKATIWYELISTDNNRVQYKIHYKFDTGDKLESNNELIYRSIEELASSLIKAGLEVESVYGDWDASLANNTSEELIFVARKS